MVNSLAIIMPQMRVIGQCICDLVNALWWVRFYEKLQTKSFDQIEGNFGCHQHDSMTANQRQGEEV